MPNYLDIYDNKQIQLTYSKDLGYKLYTFTPKPLGAVNLRIGNDLIQLLIDAHRKLGEVKGMLECIDDNDFIVRLLQVSETVSSCRIDHIEMDHSVLFSGNKTASTSDVESANKCFEALRLLRGKPITQKSLGNLHTSIMATGEVEYWKKHQPDYLGSIRTVQSKLSLEPGINVVNDLKYNPTPPECLKNLLDEMLEYYKKDTKYDILIKAALIHYQFESLHPFLGGNGRIGRLLIHEIFLENALMNYSVLPFSEYLAQNRVEYFDRLWSAQYSGNISQWVTYFLTGVLSSAELTIKRLNQYVDARKMNLAAIAKYEKHSSALMAIFNYLEKNILIDIKTAATVLSVSFNTASKMLNMLIDIGVLRALDDKKRYKVYAYSVASELLN